MPNYIKNRLTFIGTEERVKELVETYSTTYPAVPSRSYVGDLICINKDTGSVGWLNENTNIFSQRNCEDIQGMPDSFEPNIDPEWTRFPDLNKIIPMPESLAIEVCSNVLTAAERAVNYPLNKNQLIASLEKVNRENATSILDFNDNDLKLYNICIDNFKNYGHMYWHTWSIANWGTKWNVFSCEKKEENIFEFETAWKNIITMIDKIAEDYKDIKIEYEWADEDTGYNCGTAIFQNGNSTVKIPEGGSKEAYEISFKLRPDRAENYELIDGNYKYKDDN